MVKCKYCKKEDNDDICTHPEQIPENKLITPKEECEECWLIKKEVYIGNQIQKAVSTFTDFIDMGWQFIKEQPLYYDGNKIWWFYNKEKCRWEIIDETDLMNYVESNVNVKGTVHANVKSPIIESLKRVGRLNKPEENKETWIQYENKIYDINGGEEFETNEKYFVTNPIPWSIGDSEETPKMDTIFEEWVGEKHIDTLYEIIAYCCLPSYPIHRIFCFTGSGSNGKSSFMGLIKKFIGNNNIVSTELDNLIDSRFESAKLYKKLVCIMGETNFNAIKKTSLIKRLVGQDLIGYEFKNKNPFDDKNYAKILIATNTLPITYDKTSGFYRRWLIIDFPNEFTEEVDILNEIPDEEYNNLARKCLRIIKELWEKRKFTNEGSIEERKQKYEEKSNPLSSFIKEECLVDVNTEMPFFMFYESYVDWLEKRGYRKVSKRELGLQLEEEGFERERKSRKKSDGTYTTWYYVIGLRLKSYEEVEFGGEIYSQ